MDAGFLNMFHDAGNVHVLTVGEGVHVHLHGMLQDLSTRMGCSGFWGTWAWKYSVSSVAS